MRMFIWICSVCFLTQLPAVRTSASFEQPIVLCSHKKPAKQVTTTAIPHHIWQTYKCNKLPLKARACQLTWMQKNSDYAYTFMNDADIESYILNNWNENTYNFFKACPLGVMKADLWRYLIIATDGGVYSDIDAFCILPINKWMEKQIAHPACPHQLIVCLENHTSFCQWTFAATKNHPAMHYVAEYLVQNWLNHGIDLSNPHFVHATTGPAIWTDALNSYLAEPLGTPPGEIYQKYCSNLDYKNKINALGVYLFPQDFFAGIAAANLYGSQHFEDGYVRWTQEAKKLHTPGASL